MIGNDPANSRHQRFEHRIGPWEARRLAVKWVATTTGDVSATPAVANGAVYFGDFGGTLWKLDADTAPCCGRIRSRTTRASPATSCARAPHSPATRSGDLKHPNMLGIDVATGDLRWMTQVHPDPRDVGIDGPSRGM